MKNFKSFLLSCLVSSTFGFGMQKQQQSKQVESKPTTIHAQHKSNSGTFHSTPIVLNMNLNDGSSQKQTVFPTEGLINLQGNHPPALPLAARHEQLFITVKQNFLSWAESKIKTFDVLTKANLEKIKNFSPCQTINQKSLYQKDLAKSVDAYNTLLDQIKPETKAMLKVEITTSAQYAAEIMEKQVLNNDARTICYEEACLVKELQIVIEVQQQSIKDCDQRINNFKSEAVQDIRSHIEKVSTEALITHEIPSLEKQLHGINLMIQKYEKDPAILAQYRDEYFKLTTQRAYLEKVVQFRQATQKFEQLKELQVLFAGFTAQNSQLPLKEQQLLQAGEKAILEEGKPQYQINSRLTQEAKDWLTKCGIASEQFENLTYFDALQTHIGNEIITSINDIAKQESHAVFDMETREYIGMTRDAFALASEANFAGNPLEAVALFKIATTFEQATKDSISAKNAQTAVNVKSDTELRFDVTSLKQAFDMLASKADTLSDDAKIALKNAYESFDNLPPQQKVQQLMEITAFALFSSRIKLGSTVLTTVIKHAVKILPMVHAQSIMQRMGQAIAKVNPRVVTSTGQQVAVGNGSGGTAAQALTKFQHGIYEDAPYHVNPAPGKSPAPKDGQTALDNSVQIKDTSRRRIGVSEGEYVTLSWTRLDAKTGKNLYHGHVEASSWKELPDQLKKTLENAGLVNSKGEILKR